MPLARYIEVFQSMPTLEAIEAVQAGCYGESELESLFRNESRTEVRAAIASMQIDETNETALIKKTPKKPVPDVVLEFWQYDEKSQINAIENGSRDSDLFILQAHSQLGRVLTAINDRIKNHPSLSAKWSEQAEDHEKNRAAFMVAEREDSKCNTMLHLLPVATQINEKVERFQAVEKEATMLMLEIGLALEFVKEQLPHGQLIKWIESNLTISRMHAHRFRQLAQVFIKANSLKSDECLLLVDPANSKEALGAQLRQMAFDFLGDKTQAELFDQYKIKYKEPQKMTYHPPTGENQLPEGETREHVVALATWTSLSESMNRNGLDQETWAYLHTAERQALYDIVNELTIRLRKSLKD